MVNFGDLLQGYSPIVVALVGLHALGFVVCAYLLSTAPQTRVKAPDHVE